MQKPLITAQTEIEVPFQDVDPMQIAWHGNYFRYFEAARAALLRTIDYDYPQMQESGYLWPIIEAHVRFVQALLYAQRVQVQAGLVEWENRMKIEYLVRDTASGKRLTTGYTIQCAIDGRTRELQLVSPHALLDRLKPYL
ncbi:MAG: acyl-CoA thioesterase [Gammaproteobacteria bacterium]